MPEAPPPSRPSGSQGPPTEDEASPAKDACPNCGNIFEGAYCPRCGQKRRPLQQPIHHFIGESIQEYFGLDGRLWRSLKLLIQPGRLTQEYLAGRRVAYLRPLRLYLTSTLLFFFLLALLDPIGGAIEPEAVEADSSVAVHERLAAVDSMLADLRLERAEDSALVDSLQRVFEGFRTDSLADVEIAVPLPGLGGTQEALEEAEEDLEELNDSSSRNHLRQLEWQHDLLTTWPPDSIIHVGDMEAAAERLFPTSSINIELPGWMPTGAAMNDFRSADTPEELRTALAGLLRAAVGHLPTVMFLLLPVFALLLKLIYVRRGWYYTENLVFALHTHAFVFLVFTVIAVLLAISGGAGWARWISGVLFFGIPLYFYAAQKRVYGQGWFKTALKAFVLGWIYLFVLLAVGTVLTIILAALWG